MYSEEVTKNTTEAAKFYAAKDYDLAASKYADACATFNEENGADDADLLLLYGKALFQNGVAKSGVLGGAPNDQEEEKEEKEDEKEEDENFQFEEGFAEEEEEEDDEDKENNEINEDENGGDHGLVEADDQSDFEAAWEILDLARSIFAEKVELLAAEKDKFTVPYLKDDEEPTSEYVSAVQKLSETYDLLGEVSLESENFPQAAIDLESCLNLRTQLYDAQRSALVSESHYKLSLALEFCVGDPKLRQKAAQQMKLAIDCVKTRASSQTDESAKAENRELLRDLQERYKELEKDPQQEIQAQQMDMIKGLLGEAIGGGGATDLTSMVKKAPTTTAPVNDLSSMVKKRKAKPSTAKESKKPRQE